MRMRMQKKTVWNASDTGKLLHSTVHKNYLITFAENMNERGKGREKITTSARVFIMLPVVYSRCLCAPKKSHLIYIGTTMNRMKHRAKERKREGERPAECWVNASREIEWARVSCHETHLKHTQSTHTHLRTLNTQANAKSAVHW